MNEDRALARRAIALIDLTDLSDDCTPAAIDALVQRALQLELPVAALCIWPRFLRQARAALGVSRIKLATVVNFPDGGEDIAETCRQTRQALEDGAVEIDFVLPWRAFLEGRTAVARDMIHAVAACLTPGAKLKVILETGALESPDAIAAASRLALGAGADFLKTSTGKTKLSATPEAARIMLTSIRESGRNVGFKASGGLRSLSQARDYLALADEIMGADWANADHMRFGASSLLDPLLAAL